MSSYDPVRHHRRSIRIPGYDYSQTGAYFITIIVHGREFLLNEITDGKTHLSQYGRIVERTWFDLPAHYPHVELDAFVIMPDHVHGILVLEDGPGPRHGLPEIVRAFKSFSAKRINWLRRRSGNPVWQRDYYEHVIRDNEDYLIKRNYILDNPRRWEEKKKR